MRITRPTQPDPVSHLRPGPSPIASASAARVVRSMHRSRLERRSASIAIAAVVGVWLLVVFANALADASTQASRLARERTVNATLDARVAAGSAEVATIQARSFLDFLARSYGMGEPRERPFALTPGAPEPRPMTPLGYEAVSRPPSTPLEDWLDLLIGG